MFVVGNRLSKTVSNRSCVDDAHLQSRTGNDAGPEKIVAPTHRRGLIEREQETKCFSLNGKEWADLHETCPTRYETIQLLDEGMIDKTFVRPRRLRESELVASNQRKIAVEKPRRHNNIIVANHNKLISIDGGLCQKLVQKQKFHAGRNGFSDRDAGDLVRNPTGPQPHPALLHIPVAGFAQLPCDRDNTTRLIQKIHAHDEDR